MQRAVSGACVLCSTDLLLARPLALPATRSATESSFGITNLCDLLPIPVSAASTGLSVRGAMLSFHWYHRVGPLRTLYTLLLLGITWRVLLRALYTTQGPRQSTSIITQILFVSLQAKICL